MLNDPPLEVLLKHVDNRYQLVIVASKRARQLNKGANPLIETDSKKAVSIALKEISQGMISYQHRDEK
jgi:DNA-directed RNA polymerase subunit omega